MVQLQVQESLKNSVQLARDYVERERTDFVSECRALVPEAAKMITQGKGKAHFEDIGFLFAARIDAAYLFSSSGDLRWSFTQDAAQRVAPVWLRRNFEKESPTASKIVSLPGGQSAIAALIPLRFLTGDGSVIIALRLLPKELSHRLKSITLGYNSYLQLKMLQKPLKKSHFITFSIVTMLAIFSAVWFGFYLAKNLTGPIQKLLTATQRIAEGDLEVRLDPDRQDENRDAYGIV